MKLRYLAAVPCALVLAACSTGGGADQSADLAGRSLMWADGITADCEVPPTIKFGADGKVSGNAGCNYLVGSWSMEGAKIDLSGLGSTRRMCGPAIMQMEDAFMQNLGKTVYATAEGDKVHFLDADHKLVMTLVPEIPGSCK